MLSVRVITQKEFEDGKFGENDYLSGLVILWDKGTGVTSHDIVAMVRREITLRIGKKIKVGHAGTLDPLATGLLILLIGKATKIQSKYMGMDKEYEVEMILGYESDTYDVDGNLNKKILNNHKIEDQSVFKNNIEQKLREYEGEISQQVPIYSAVKIRGKKLYQYARSGTKISLPIRTVTIYKIALVKIEEIKDPWDEGSVWIVRMIVKCSSGTYIRSLVRDLGLALGMGGVVRHLRRSQIGIYHL